MTHHLQYAQSACKISNISFIGATNALRDAPTTSDSDKLDRVSEEIFERALDHLDRAISAGEFSRPVSADLYSQLQREQAAESETIRWIHRPPV